MPRLMTEQCGSLVKEVKVPIRTTQLSIGSLNDRCIFDTYKTVTSCLCSHMGTLPDCKPCSYTVLIPMYFTDPASIIFPVNTNNKSEYQSVVSVSYSYLNNCNCDPNRSANFLFLPLFL
jgi:hypothetical protein